MRKRDKRREIMQAAEKLFATRRFHEITLDEVARLAKVGKGTIYLHFADKDDLFFQVATSGFDELCELVHRKVPEQAPFVEQLLGACTEITRFFDRRRQLFRMMMAEEGRMHWAPGTVKERWLERRKTLVAALAAILQEGVDEGQIRSDVPSDVLSNYLLGMMRTCSRDLQDAPEPLRRLECLIDLFLSGAGRSRRPADSKAQGKPS
jgi:TetR/AcrR family fatty acid metabolism transcriptional regulator